MVSEKEINTLIAARVKRVLDLTELTTSEEKFPKVRSLILDEFGHSGLRSDISKLLRQGGQSG